MTLYRVIVAFQEPSGHQRGGVHVEIGRKIAERQPFAGKRLPTGSDPLRQRRLQ